MLSLTISSSSVGMYARLNSFHAARGRTTSGDCGRVQACRLARLSTGARLPHATAQGRRARNGAVLLRYRLRRTGPHPSRTLAPITCARRGPHVKPVGERNAGNPHVAFDEREEETEQWQGLRHRHLAKATGNSNSPRLPPPRLFSTLPNMNTTHKPKGLPLLPVKFQLRQDKELPPVRTFAAIKRRCWARETWRTWLSSLWAPFVNPGALFGYLSILISLVAIYRLLGEQAMVERSLGMLNSLWPALLSLPVWAIGCALYAPLAAVAAERKKGGWDGERFIYFEPELLVTTEFQGKRKWQRGRVRGRRHACRRRRRLQDRD